MRAGVADAVGAIGVRQVVARLARIEGELQHLHAGEAGLGEQRLQLGRDIAEILGDELHIVEPAGEPADEVHARPLDPLAVFGGLVAVGHGPIGLEAAEMVDAQRVIELGRALDAADPPAVAVGAHGVPAVERRAPELAVLGEIVGRDAGDGGGYVLIVELEALGARPCVGRVHGDVDRDIADDADAVVVRIFAQERPLAEKEQLNEGIKLHVLRELLGPAAHGLGPVHAQIVVRPLCPRLAGEVILRRHEEGIVIEPALVLAPEGGEFLRHRLPAAGICLAQKREAIFIELAVIDLRGIAAEIDAPELAFFQKAVGHQKIEIDEIGVSGEGGVALIGAVAIARRPHGEDLPPGLIRLGEKVDKIISRLPQRADAVPRGQRKDGQQNTAASLQFHNYNTPFWLIATRHNIAQCQNPVNGEASYHVRALP